jgi:hypothetical protein
MTLKELYILLNTEEVCKALTFEGKKNSPNFSLQLSLEASIKNLREN